MAKKQQRESDFPELVGVVDRDLKDRVPSQLSPKLMESDKSTGCSVVPNTGLYIIPSPITGDDDKNSNSPTGRSENKGCEAIIRCPVEHVIGRTIYLRSPGC